MCSSKRVGQSNAETVLADACPLIKKFHTQMVKAAMGKPILDVACGTGRNALPLLALGCTVICTDNDLTRLRPADGMPGALIRRQLDLVTDSWPFERSSVGGIVNVHFLLMRLFPYFESSLSSGGYLLLETVPGCGGNYLQLPKVGELRSLLEGAFRLEFYKERTVGPRECGAVAVQLLARRQ